MQKEQTSNSQKKIEAHDWKRINNDFKNDHEIFKKCHKSFGAIMKELFEKKKITNKIIFTQRTYLYDELYKKCQQADYIPRIKTLVTLCMALELDFSMALLLMESAGLAFNKRDNVHFAYILLITKYRGQNIENCNLILQRLGIGKDHFLGKSVPNTYYKKNYDTKRQP